MHEEFLIIGTVMLVAGVIILILGLRKSTRNIWFWAAFPIFHGLEEIVEYYIASVTSVPFFVERLEVLLGILASMALFITVVEFTGVIPSEGGKLAGFFGIVILGSIALFFPETVIEYIENDTFLELGPLMSTPLQFLANFLIPMLATVVLIVSHLHLTKEQQKRKFQISKSENLLVIFLVISLSLFALFEGLTVENSVFLVIQSLITVMFIAIPLIVIFASKPGIQRFLIIDATNGFLIYGFHFTTRNVIAAETENEEHNDALLVSAFLAALSGFSGDYLKAGTSLKLESHHMLFYISRVGDVIFTLQTLMSTSALDKAFLNTVNEIGTNVDSKDQDRYTEIIVSNFREFF